MENPKFTNRLVNETSPYLLQHAHNPVDWYPWGDEAFEKAKSEDKPVLISIGYSSCHWCHVMEHESFENEETARLMNKNFVNIKIDLEERPDLDKIYMPFVQMTTGQGGYPLNVFLTPDRLPFYGGTYFPPVPRYNMPSFQQLLTSISDAYKNRRDEILHSANDILGELRRVGQPEIPKSDINLDQLDSAFLSFTKTFDKKNGGFGGAPKFPPPMSLEFLLRYYKRTGDENALQIVRKTCEKMANGGINDQLGGGFHRYTVDENWLTPHFEKMLYDNAQLIRIYLHLFQITGEESFKRVAVETLEYVKREMIDQNGGFYSAQDADSEGIEGKFFIWSSHEIEEILGERDAQIFNFYYDVSEEGNFEGKNILNINNTLAETAEALKINQEELLKSLERSREKLFLERENRIKPFRDEKILTAWNGLMLAAFAEAGAILQNKQYLEIAGKNADFILENLQNNDLLLRSFKDGTAKLNAYLEDYANFIDGLIELFQVSGEIKYLVEAKRLTDLMITEFWDTENGGFFFTASNHEGLIVRSKDYYDNATPSGNSVAADILLKLSKLTGDEKYEQFAELLLKLVISQVVRFPQAFGRVLSTLEFYLNPVKEIVIFGEIGNDFEKELWQEYLPLKIVIPTQDKPQSNLIPLLENRNSIDGKLTAYVCENFVCKKPAVSLTDFKEQIQ